MTNATTITALCRREDLIHRSYHFSTQDGLNFEWPHTLRGRDGVYPGSWYVFALVNGTPNQLIGLATDLEVARAKGLVKGKVERPAGDKGFTLALRPAMLTVFVGA